MGIFDFVIIGAAVLFAVIGLIKGGAKIFFGFFMLLIIMVGSAFISANVCPLFLQKENEGSVEYTKAATILMEPLGKALPSEGTFGELLDADVTEGADGEIYVGDVKLKEAITEKVPYVGGAVASFVVKAVHPGEHLRTTFSYKITEYIYEIILWVILVIILAIIRNIIRKKIFVYLDKNSGVSKVDRVIGAVISLVLLVAIFWGAGALLAYFDDGANWAHTADEFITKGVIAKPFMENNPLLKIINVTLPVTPPSGGDAA